MLEKMGDFFDARIDSYEEHQLTCIASAKKFYPFTASLLPMEAGANVLDLGCGTGLELEYYFKKNPLAQVTGIDLAPGMLDVLKQKFPHNALHLICASYFDVPLGENRYDAAVSVESLHHFTKAEKIPLYRKLHRALKGNGFFILTDYFALNDEEETHLRAEYQHIRLQENLPEGEFYHFDTPLTVEHEMQALKEAGFGTVDILEQWNQTFTLKASE